MHNVIIFSVSRRICSARNTGIGISLNSHVSRQVTAALLTNTYSTQQCSCGFNRQSTKLTKSLCVPSTTSLATSVGVATSSRVAAYTVLDSKQGFAKDINVKSDQWDLFAALVMERTPVITQIKDALQEKYVKYLSQIEFELSKKSDHEVRHDNDIRMLEKVRAGETDLGNVQTARDDKDRWVSEAQRFKPTDRETDADGQIDLKSLERALDSHLLLVVKQKLGSDYRWICPHAQLQEGETLRQAADRMIKELFPEMKAKVLGHAPWGFYKYKYPPTSSSNLGVSSVGAKVFFYKAQVLPDFRIQNTLINKNIQDFVWLKRTELPSKLQPEYLRKLSECLIDQ